MKQILKIETDDPITAAADFKMGQTLGRDFFLRNWVKVGFFLRYLNWKWYIAVLIVPSSLLIWSKYF